MSNKRPNLYDLALPEIEQMLGGWNQPTYRARQLYRQIYANLADDPAQMTDLPAALRQRLAAETRLGVLEQVRLQTADQGLTRKALFGLPSGAVVESVLMVYPDRATVCVSTQAGCAMGCVFCATGRLGLLSNLSSGEIVEQVLWAARELKGLKTEGREEKASTRNDGNSVLSPRPSALTNVVFMGMGEPFANYDRWWGAVERLHDPQGLNMGARSLTVSTVGLVPSIRRLAAEQLPINLAISLHAPDDTLRSEMMPINKRYPIADLLESTREYIATTNRRVSFEYVLLQGKNDSPEQAAALAELLDGMLCHVNLIPWNPVPGTPLGRSERARVLRFQQALQERGIACTVRVERGVAIAAACGQLAGTPISEPIVIGK
ncbi:MAG TPA: 23S rRNA (adenine(2503)-C(2))-methyltransferase RlmN [Roseiflexaceae bacterium]|nr:23S rRNA (adenine(2503)-C(2))-methyltransferase RlmN [Roseiflexaceae bacterium]